MKLDFNRKKSILLKFTGNITKNTKKCKVWTVKEI